MHSTYERYNSKTRESFQNSRTKHCKVITPQNRPLLLVVPTGAMEDKTNANVDTGNSHLRDELVMLQLRSNSVSLNPIPAAV